MTTSRSIFTILCASALLAGCGGGNDPDTPARTLPLLATSGTLIGPASEGTRLQWPDGSTATGGRGQPVANVGCLINEDYHIHAHLAIIKDGVTLKMPRNIGLTGCAYEIHTHGATGVVHVETDREKKFYLGQFFAIWGQPLSRTDVAGLQGQDIRFFVIDGGKVAEISDDPATIELARHRSIVITVGTPPASLPQYTWPADL